MQVGCCLVNRSGEPVAETEGWTGTEHCGWMLHMLVRGAGGQGRLA